VATKGKFEPQEREYLTGLARQIDAKLVPFADAVEKAVADLDRSAVSIKLYLGRLANRVNAQSSAGSVRRRSRKAISDLSTTVRVRRVRLLSQQYDKLKKQHGAVEKKLDALSRELTAHHEALLKDLGLEQVLRSGRSQD
jgi:hypothetical protein